MITVLIVYIIGVIFYFIYDFIENRRNYNISVVGLCMVVFCSIFSWANVIVNANVIANVIAVLFTFNGDMIVFKKINN